MQADRFAPVGTMGTDAIQVAERITPTDDRRLTEYSTHVVGMTDASVPKGEVTQLSDKPVDVSGLLAADESITGPIGLLEGRVPPSVAGEIDWPMVTVFSEAGAERTGVIRMVRGAPELLAGDKGWQVLGINRFNTLVEVATADGESTIRGRGGADGVAWSHTSAGQAQWIVPGVVVR